MPRETIADRIQQLTEASAKGDSDLLGSLAADLRVNLEQAYGSLLRGFYALVGLWLAAFAIAVGLVSEGEIVSLKVTTVKSILVVLPALVGFQYYLLTSATALAWLLREALHSVHKKRYPLMCDLDLEYLFDPPTFVGAEEFFAQSRNKLGGLGHLISEASGYVMAAALFLGGVAALAHVSYLAFQSSGAPWYLTAISVGLGMLAAARGLVFIENANAVTKA